MGVTEGSRRRKGRRKAAPVDAAENDGSAREFVELVDVVSARRMAMIAAVGLCVGVALTATGEVTLGPIVDAASLAAAIYAAHKLGRTGPDPGPDFSR